MVKLSSCELRVDKLSDLPDCLIQRILSFLPTTRDAIRTDLLSKRWRYQWRQVPVLIFNCLDYNNYSKDIDSVLNQYECSKLDKFLISYAAQKDPHFDRKIRFAITRDVKELILEIDVSLISVRLPESLFSHSSLVKLQLLNCSVLVLRIEKVNLKHLKEFSARGCKFSDRAIKKILSGCPLLESLTLATCNLGHLVIASKSLRKLALLSLFVHDMEVSCPNIEELCLNVRHTNHNLDDKKIIVCDVVRLTAQGHIVIASNSLKKLVLEYLFIPGLEILCPKLKELQLLHKLHTKHLKVVNLQSLVSATLDSELYGMGEKEILWGLQHVKELKIGRHFIWTALCNFYELEKLVIKVSGPEKKYHCKNRRIVENCWSRKHVCDRVPSNLKIVQITGLSERDAGWEAVICFAELLLENAQVLDKMSLTIEDSSPDFINEVSRQLSNVSWCSQHAMIELCDRREQGWIKQVISKNAIL